MGYKANCSISLDDDSAALESLDTRYSYEIGFNMPMPKISKVSALGINGDIDLTNSLGATTFENRTVNISLAVKAGAVNGDSYCSQFVRDYDGKLVRVFLPDGRFLRGRLVVIGDNRSDALRMLSVQIDVDPLIYSAAYLPVGGLDVSPAAFSANRWNTGNVFAISPAQVTATGGTIQANSGANAHYFYIDQIMTDTAGYLYRFKFSNFNNCYIEFTDRKPSKYAEKSTSIYEGITYLETTGGQFEFTVHPIDPTLAASFECSFRDVEVHSVNNIGKTVPFDIKSGYRTASGMIYPKMYVNGTIFDLFEFWDWREYAPAVLREGANTIATIVEDEAFNPTTSTGTILIRYRSGVV